MKNYNVWVKGDKVKTIEAIEAKTAFHAEIEYGRRHGIYISGGRKNPVSSKIVS